MSVHNFIPSMEEGDDSSDAEISPEYGNLGTIQDENEQPPDVLSFDNVHGQIGEKEGGDKSNILRFHPLPLPENQSLVDSMGDDLVSSGIQIQAHLRGRFSHSEDMSSLSNPGTVGANNKEDADGSSISSKDAIGLIFYRRNKFKVIGTVSVPNALGGIKLGANSRTSKITSLHAELDAIESLEGTPVRVIHSNPKEKGTAISSRSDTSNNRGHSKTTITAEALPRVDLRFDDRNNSRRDELDSSHQGQAMSVPVCWEKLQFRHATAKKRGTWQYFYLRLTVTATLEDGKTCVLSRTQTSAITVRGRSPQSFPSHTSKTNRTGPLTTGRGRSANTPAARDSLLASMQDQGLPKDPNWRHSPLDLVSVDCQSTLDVAPENLLFYDFSDLGIWNNNNLQWQDDNMKNTDVQEYLDRVDAPVSPLNTSNHSHDNANTNSQDLGYSNNFFIPSLETHLLPSVPNLGSIFNLPHSFSTDYGNLPDMSTASVSFTAFPAKADREIHRTISNAILDDFNGQNEQSEILEDEMESDEERRTYSYEYIPLSINDWTVPVDAVYRPHGVHARKVQNVEKSITKKRYFLSVK